MAACVLRSRFVWCALVLALFGVSAAACAPEVLESAGGQCSPQNPTPPGWGDTTTFENTLGNGQAPGAFGCLRALWGDAPDQRHSLQIKLMPDGSIVPLDDAGAYTPGPIALPSGARRETLRLTLFLFGAPHQPGGTADPREASTLCGSMKLPAYRCAARAASECWLSMFLAVTSSASDSRDVAGCMVNVNPKLNETEPPPPPPSDAGGPDIDPPELPKPERPDDIPPPSDAGQVDGGPPPTDGGPPPTDPGQPEQTPEPDQPDAGPPPSDGGRPEFRPETRGCLGACVITIAGPPPGAGLQLGASDGPGDNARFRSPHGAAVDISGTISTSGSIFITDTGNYAIRRLTHLGNHKYNVSTYAGGTPGNANTDGPLRTATFLSPYGIAFGQGGKLYVVGRNSQSLRIIDPMGNVTSRTFAQLQDPFALAYDAKNQRLWISDVSGSQGSTSISVSPYTFFALHGGTAKFYAGKEGYVTGMAYLPGEGLLYVTHDGPKHCIQKVDAAFIRSPYTSKCSTGFTNGSLSLAEFNRPRSLAVDSKGDLYVFDRGSATIRKILPSTGLVSTVAGSYTPGQSAQIGYVNGEATKARFGEEVQLAVDGDDNLIIVDTRNHAIRKLVFR